MKTWKEADNETKAFELGHIEGLRGAGPRENPFKFPESLARNWEAGRKRGQDWRKSYGCKSRA